MRSIDKKSGGFTIIELLIATTVFSVVVTVSVVGFLQIGRLFYKGVILTNTQQTVRQIVDRMSSDIKGASSISAAIPISLDRYYTCVGSNRYTYYLHKHVDLSNHDTTNNFGLLYDHLAGSTGCGSPYAGGTAFKPPGDPDAPVELLGDNMQLNHFSITPENIQGLVYILNVNVVYGQDTFLSDDTDSPGDKTCDGSLAISQYCAQSGLVVTVASR